MASKEIIISKTPQETTRQVLEKYYGRKASESIVSGKGFVGSTNIGGRKIGLYVMPTGSDAGYGNLLISPGVARLSGLIGNEEYERTAPESGVVYSTTRRDIEIAIANQERAKNEQAMAVRRATAIRTIDARKATQEPYIRQHFTDRGTVRGIQRQEEQYIPPTYMTKIKRETTPGHVALEYKKGFEESFLGTSFFIPTRGTVEFITKTTSVPIEGTTVKITTPVAFLSDLGTASLSGKIAGWGASIGFDILTGQVLAKAAGTSVAKKMVAGIDKAVFGRMETIGPINPIIGQINPPIRGSMFNLGDVYPRTQKVPEVIKKDVVGLHIKRGEPPKILTKEQIKKIGDAWSKNVNEHAERLDKKIIESIGLTGDNNRKTGVLILKTIPVETEIKKTAGFLKRKPRTEEIVLVTETKTISDARVPSSSKFDFLKPGKKIKMGVTEEMEYWNRSGKSAFNMPTLKYSSLLNKSSLKYSSLEERAAKSDIMKTVKSTEASSAMSEVSAMKTQSLQKMIQSMAHAQSSATAEITLERQAIRQATQQATKTKSTPINIFKPKKILTMRISSISKNNANIFRYTKRTPLGFDVYARVFGKPKKVASDVTYFTALERGQKYLDVTPAASFKVFPTGRVATGGKRGSINAALFKLQRSKSGKSFVERTRYRIDTPGEKNLLARARRAAHGGK